MESLFYCQVSLLNTGWHLTFDPSGEDCATIACPLGASLTLGAQVWIFKRRLQDEFEVWVTNATC